MGSLLLFLLLLLLLLLLILLRLLRPLRLLLLLLIMCVLPPLVDTAGVPLPILPPLPPPRRPLPRLPAPRPVTSAWRPLDCGDKDDDGRTLGFLPSPRRSGTETARRKLEAGATFAASTMALCSLAFDVGERGAVGSGLVASS